MLQLFIMAKLSLDVSESLDVSDVTANITVISCLGMHAPAVFHEQHLSSTP